MTPASIASMDALLSGRSHKSSDHIVFAHVDIYVRSGMITIEIPDRFKIVIVSVIVAI